MNAYYRSDGTFVTGHTRAEPHSNSGSTANDNSSLSSTRPYCGAPTSERIRSSDSTPALVTTISPSKGFVDEFIAYQRDIFDPNGVARESARIALAGSKDWPDRTPNKWPEFGAADEAKVIPCYRAMVRRLKAANPTTHEIEQLSKRLLGSFGDALTAAERCQTARRAGNGELWRVAQQEYANDPFEEAFRRCSYLADELRPPAPARADPSPATSPVPAVSQQPTST